jgi:hypothetical protein
VAIDDATRLSYDLPVEKHGTTVFFPDQGYGFVYVMVLSAVVARRQRQLLLLQTLMAGL